MIGGWTVVEYARIVKWPSIVTIVLNIIATTAHWNLSFMWLFLIMLTIYLGYAAARMYRGSLTNSGGLGFAAGLIVGVFTSLFQFVWYHNVAAFFEIITTSLLAILVSLLMSTSTYLVLTREPKKPTHSQ